MGLFTDPNAVIYGGPSCPVCNPLIRYTCDIPKCEAFAHTKINENWLCLYHCWEQNPFTELPQYTNTPFRLRVS